MIFSSFNTIYLRYQLQMNPWIKMHGSFTSKKGNLVHLKLLHTRDLLLVKNRNWNLLNLFSICKELKTLLKKLVFKLKSSSNDVVIVDFFEVRINITLEPWYDLSIFDFPFDMDNIIFVFIREWSVAIDTTPQIFLCDNYLKMECPN